MTTLAFPRLSVSTLVANGEAELKTGPFGTQLKASEYTELGTPVINVRNIGMGSIKPDKLEFIPESTRDRLSGHILRRGDIVFGRKGAVERHVFIRAEQDGWLQGSDCLRLRLTSSRVEPLFASYFFLTEEHQQWMMNQCSHGATMASLNQAILERIELPVPPLQVQRRIAGILSSYDELVANSQRRIQILETMARALYREWFVEFRFPGHEKFPRLNSPLGDIPHGWEVKTLGQICENFDRLRRPLSKMQRAERQGEYPYYGAAKVFDYINAFIFDGEYLLMAEDGSVITTGRHPVLQLVNEKFWPNNHTHVLVGKPPFSTHFLYLGLSEVDISPYITGAAQPKITQENMNRIPFVCAPRELHQQLDRLVAPMIRQTQSLQRQIQNLRRTRDLLLPRLLSGQITLTDTAA